VIHHRLREVRMAPNPLARPTCDDSAMVLIRRCQQAQVLKLQNVDFGFLLVICIHVSEFITYLTEQWPLLDPRILYQQS
jgi:hypothetical protein